MTAPELIDASLKFMLYLSPFALVFSVIASADQLVDLVKRATAVKRSKDRGW